MSLEKFILRAKEIGQNPAAEGLHGLGEMLRTLGIKLEPHIKRGRMTEEGWLGGAPHAPPPDAKSFRQKLSDDIAGLGDHMSGRMTQDAYADPVAANALLGIPLAAGGAVGIADLLMDDEEDPDAALLKLKAQRGIR